MAWWNPRSWYSPDYTQLVVNIIEALAHGDYRPQTVGMVEAVAGLWARGLASAVVSADMRLIERAITPQMLHQVGRDLLLQGESVWAIGPMARTYYRANGVTIQGGVDEADWFYTLNLAGPTESLVAERTSTEVLHFRINESSTSPWRGQSPLAIADVGVAEALQSYLRSELNHVNPQLLVGDGLPTDFKAAEIRQKHEQDSEQAERRNQLRPFQNFKATDAKMVRPGPQPFASASAIDQDTKQGVLAAGGVPQGLLLGNDGGTSAREDYRRFVATTMVPIALLAQSEWRKKVPREITIDAGVELRASDIASRARGFQSLVGGRMRPEVAAEQSGFTGLTAAAFEERMAPPEIGGEQDDDGDDE